MKLNFVITFASVSARGSFLMGACLVLVSTSLFAQTPESPAYPDISSFLWGNTSINAPAQATKVNGTGYTYRVLPPKNYSTLLSDEYPVIIYLHRASEDGTDGLQPLQAGNNSADGALALVSTANPDNQTSHPCFFVVPQLPIGKSWSSDEAATEITNIINTMETQYHNTVNPNQIFLTGQYEGGNACYDLPCIMSQANHLGLNPFAASVPMWSTTPTRDASTLPHLPLWVFNAQPQDVTTITPDSVFDQDLRDLGFSIINTLYNPQTSGGAWGELAYQEPQLLPWLFSQVLGKAQQPFGSFAITGETTLSGGTSFTLSGTASTAAGIANILWTNETNDQGGGAPLTTQSWTTSAIPISAGSNHIQMYARGLAYSGSVFGTPTNYNGQTIVSIPFTFSPTSNLALHAPVTVSSTEVGPNVAANAVDGNATTRWSSLYSDPQWIEVDLGAKYDISEVDLTWETACGKNYQIQTSTDNVNWTTQTTVTGNTKTGLLVYLYGTNTTVSYGAPSARYVRIYGTARATSYGYSLYEVAVYAQNTQVTPPDILYNVALNKPVTVSSTEANSPNVAANAVDGNTSTRWSSAYSDPQWIEVDLGANYRLEDIELTWETACGKDYLIQCSGDGVNWTTLTTVTGNTETGLIQYPYFQAIYGRYVRMYGTARATSYGYSLYEFTVLSDGTVGAPTQPPTLTNLALKKPVTVSSIDGPADAGPNAVDGNTATRWSSAYSDPQWIVVDLGADYNISEIDLTWETACGKNYLVQTSEDAVTWTTLNTVTNNTSSGFALKYVYAEPEEGFPPVQGRFVRIYGTARATQYGYSIYELAVLGDGSEVSVQNLALDMPVTVSSTEPGPNVAANAVDGDLTTRWSSAYSDNQWIQVDLGAVHTLYIVSIDWEVACGKNYLIQTSNDGVNWTTQATITGNTTTGWHDTDFDTPILARYVRMQGLLRATQYGYSLYEFQVGGH